MHAHKLAAPRHALPLAKGMQQASAITLLAGVSAHGLPRRVTPLRAALVCIEQHRGILHSHGGAPPRALAGTLGHRVRALFAVLAWGSEAVHYLRLNSDS